MTDLFAEIGKSLGNILQGTIGLPAGVINAGVSGFEGLTGWDVPFLGDTPKTKGIKGTGWNVPFFGDTPRKKGIKRGRIGIKRSFIKELNSTQRQIKILDAALNKIGWDVKKKVKKA